MNKYEAFVKISETCSLTRAAEELECTQSAVSHAISSLEEEIGFALFSRGRGGVHLTSEGEKLIPSARAVLNSFEQFEQTASAIRGLDSGVVRIGAFTSVAVHWLPEIIKKFQEDYPNVKIKLLNGDYHDIESWIEDGSVDIGFINIPSKLQCEVTALVEDRLVAIVSKDSRFRNYPKFPVVECETEPFISLLESSDHDARNALNAAEVKPNIKFYTKDDYAIIAMVEHGLGMSIMPELLLKGRKDDIISMPLVPEAKRTIGLAVAASEKAGPAVRRFVDYIMNFVKQNK